MSTAGHKAPTAKAASGGKSAPTRTNAAALAQAQDAIRHGAEASRGIIDTFISAISPRPPAPTESRISSVDVDNTATRTATPEEVIAINAALVRPFPSDATRTEAHADLTDAELDMTIEQYLDALYAAKAKSMQVEGERVIDEFVKRAEAGRRRAEVLIS